MVNRKQQIHPYQTEMLKTHRKLNSVQTDRSLLILEKAHDKTKSH